MTLRVTTQETIDAYDLEAGGQVVRTSPSVNVEVSFDLHDYDAALEQLSIAVFKVRSRIEEARLERPW